MDPTIRSQRVRTALLVGGAVVTVVLLAVIAARHGREPDAGPALLDPSVTVPSLSGTIVAIAGDTLTVDVPQIVGAAIPERSPLRRRTVTVTRATQIMARTPKPAAEYGRERTVYAARRAEGVLTVPPHSYREAAVPKTELRVGDAIRVVDAERDLKNLLEITPTVIYKL